MKICIDFDGTVVSHEFPEIGKDIGAVPVLKRLVEVGHELILYTMRGEPTSPGDPNYLEEAVDWFAQRGIPLVGINENLTQNRWTSSRKIFAHLYIDDAALGAPLKTDLSISVRPFIDWTEVERLLVEKGII